MVSPDLPATLDNVLKNVRDKHKEHITIERPLHASFDAQDFVKPRNLLFSNVGEPDSQVIRYLRQPDFSRIDVVNYVAH